MDLMYWRGGSVLQSLRSTYNFTRLEYMYDKIFGTRLKLGYYHTLPDDLVMLAVSCVTILGVT